MINLGLAISVFIATARLYFRYYISERWLIYLLYSFAIAIMAIILQIRSIFIPDSHYSYGKLAWIVVCSSKLWLIYCLKKSSIKK